PTYRRPGDRVGWNVDQPGRLSGAHRRPSGRQEWSGAVDERRGRLRPDARIRLARRIASSRRRHGANTRGTSAPAARWADAEAGWHDFAGDGYGIAAGREGVALQGRRPDRIAPWSNDGHVGWIEGERRWLRAQTRWDASHAQGRRDFQDGRRVNPAPVRSLVFFPDIIGIDEGSAHQHPVEVRPFGSAELN